MNSPGRYVVEGCVLADVCVLLLQTCTMACYIFYCVLVKPHRVSVARFTS